MSFLLINDSPFSLFLKKVRKCLLSLPLWLIQVSHALLIFFAASQCPLLFRTAQGPPPLSVESTVLFPLSSLPPP